MAEAIVRFRPGAQQRGEDTRRRILEAALQLFATDGFDGASTRTLAECAGVKLPAIQYYFGSKDGLYRAVVEQIIQHLETHVGPLADRVVAELAGQPSRRRLIGLLCDMMDILVGLMLTDDTPQREWRQKFFARMETEPHAAFAALQDSMIRTVAQPCAELVGRLTERPPDDEQVVLRTLMIIGQAKVFCGWAPARLLHWHCAAPEHVPAVQTLLREQIHAIFRKPPAAQHTDTQPL